MADRHVTPQQTQRPQRAIRHRGEILVIGLGRFGSALARELINMGCEVLGIDSDLDRVQAHADVLTQVVQADSTNERAMRQVGGGDAETAVICIGTDIESSVLTAACLVDLGVENIWAKAITESHGRILERVGAHHVVFPEADMGVRVAHLLTGRMLEYVELDEDFALVETIAPPFLLGIPLGDSGLRAKYKVTVVCVKTPGSSFTYADRQTVLGPDDLIVVAGHRADVARFTDNG